MSARKIQDETEARKYIAKWRESGLTLAAWARSAGINGRSLHAWNVNLSRCYVIRHSVVPWVQLRRSEIPLNSRYSLCGDDFASSSEGVLRAARNLCIASQLESLRDRTRHVDRVLLQPHWRHQRESEYWARRERWRSAERGPPILTPWSAPKWSSRKRANPNMRTHTPRWGLNPARVVPAKLVFRILALANWANKHHGVGKGISASLGA